MQTQLDHCLKQLLAAGYSKSRLNQVRLNVGYLRHYLIKNYQLTAWAQVEAHHIEAFWQFMHISYRTNKGQHLHNLSVKQTIACTRLFFGWLVRHRYLLTNPCAAIDREIKATRTIYTLSQKEIVTLIEAPDTTNPLGLRDRALMELLYATGIRLGECAQLQLYDLDTVQQTLLVHQAKNHTQRVLPLTNTACYWLERYCLESRPTLAQPPLRLSTYIPPTNALWLTNHARPLSSVRISEMIRDYGEIVQIKATPHTFRHCCATHLWQQGLPLPQIQRLLGHKCLDDTQRYVHLVTLDLPPALDLLNKQLNNESED